jgi:MOSC domain-containing protein YiiM
MQTQERPATSAPTRALVGSVVSVNVSNGGVPKRPIPGTWVNKLGLESDGHEEPEPIHGGYDQAVSIYGVEAIARVAADGNTAFPGAFGENLTLQGIEMDALQAGDRLRIGDGGLVIELYANAEPCRTLAHWFVERKFARIGSKLHPEDARWYARVLTEGPAFAGDHVEVISAD